jgi:hypothetical protein
LIPSLIFAAVEALTSAFNSKELVANVSDSSLSLLVKELSFALLDSRVTSVAVSSAAGGLDERTGKRLQADLNRLAIRTGTNTPIETSLSVLMDLQLIYCTSSPDDFEIEKSKMAKLKRMTVKLFTKALRSEETSPHPFTESSLVRLLRELEEQLVTIDELKMASGANATGMDLTPCLDLVKAAGSAILKSKKQQNCSQLLMDCATSTGIEWDQTLLKSLFDSQHQEMFGVSLEVGNGEQSR